MHRAAANTPTWEPRLVEARPQENGNVVEVFEVAPGELVSVESGPTFTFPDVLEAPIQKR
jgi:hypothetical protein